MLHSDWFSVVISSASVAQVQGEVSAAPPAPAPTTPPPGPVNVVGLPAGTTPATTPGAAPGTTTSTTGQNPPLPAPARAQDMSFIWLMGGAMLLIVLVQIFAGRGERKRRAAMMSSVGKGDKVLMSGGMIGTVSELSDTELVLRVEEGKVRFSRSALQQVLESHARNSAA